MRRAFASLVGCLWLAGSARAEPGSVTHEVAISLATPSGLAGSVAYAVLPSLLAGRVLLGPGVRLSATFPGGGATFRAGSGSRGALQVDHARLLSLNLMVQASVRLTGALEVGMNLDLLGVGFGNSVEGSYSGGDPGLAGPQRAAVEHLDLFLFKNRDRGQLNSEFWVAWWSGRLGLRAGLQHAAHELRASGPLADGNRGFRSTPSRAFLSAAWRLP